jgi:hypothetical protein
VLERGGSGLGPSSMPLGEAGAERAWALPTCVGSTSTVQECVHAAGGVMFDIDVVWTACGRVRNELMYAWGCMSTGDHSEHSHAAAATSQHRRHQDAAPTRYGSGHTACLVRVYTRCGDVWTMEE